MAEERDIERWIGKRVREAGGRWYKWVSPGEVGVPDRILITSGGRIIFVELKAGNGELSPIQRLQHGRLRALGCDVRVVRGWIEAEAFARELGGGPHGTNGGVDS